MLNPQLNRKQILDRFKKDKVITIPNFLEETEAESLYTWFNQDMPANWWYVSLFPPRNNYRSRAENEEAIELETTKAIHSFRRGEFSFKFRRTVDDHNDKCGCIGCGFLRHSLKTKEVTDFLSEITGFEITAPSGIFASYYKSGDWLSPHSDNENGKIGFVLNLTKNWKAQYGGNLHFLDNKWEKITRVYVPKFNNLILFDLATYNGIPHFVSHVAPKVKEKRLAVAGWFS